MSHGGVSGICLCRCRRSSADICGWQDNGYDYSGSQRTALAAIKSLLSFGHKIGVLENNGFINAIAQHKRIALSHSPCWDDCHSWAILGTIIQP